MTQYVYTELVTLLFNYCSNCIILCQLSRSNAFINYLTCYRKLAMNLFHLISLCFFSVVNPSPFRELETLVMHSIQLYKVAKHSFIVWLTILGRLSTQDRLLKWYPGKQAQCPLCELCTDSHSHMSICSLSVPSLLEFGRI